MDTKKLIGDLRICADDDIICPACERYDKMGAVGGTAECVSRLLLEAAAALEEQQKQIAELEKERHWIPVTERVPDTIPCNAGTVYSEVVNVLTTGRKVLTAIYDGTDFIADAEFWEAENEEITHWAPVLLPLPGKEYGR